jgi:predicted small secreted protein
MKKLLWIFVATVAMTFAACGGSTTDGSANDSVVADSIDTVVVDSVDTVAVDSVVK